MNCQVLLIVLFAYVKVARPQALPIIVSTWDTTRNATIEAWNRLYVQQEDILDAIVGGCSVCELDKACGGSVGPGDKPSESGEVTQDAMIMDGRTMDVGSVGCLRRITNAIGVAHAVMKYTTHTLLVGELAMDFAIEMGFPEESLESDRSNTTWQEWQDADCQPNFWENVTPDPTTSCGPYTPIPASDDDSPVETEYRTTNRHKRSADDSPVESQYRTTNRHKRSADDSPVESQYRTTNRHKRSAEDSPVEAEYRTTNRHKRSADDNPVESQYRTTNRHKRSTEDNPVDSEYRTTNRHKRSTDDSPVESQYRTTNRHKRATDDNPVESQYRNTNRHKRSADDSPVENQYRTTNRHKRSVDESPAETEYRTTNRHKRSTNSQAREEPDHDTIGMIAVDAFGDPASGTSTNGLTHKISGRIGDSPIAGAGSFAEAGIGAAAATGNGDIMLRMLPSYHAVQLMGTGMSPVEAANAAVDRIAQYYPNYNGALIAVDVTGAIGVACHGYTTFPYNYINPTTGQVVDDVVVC